MRLAGLSLLRPSSQLRQNAFLENTSQFFIRQSTRCHSSRDKRGQAASDVNSSTRRPACFPPIDVDVPISRNDTSSRGHQHMQKRFHSLKLQSDGTFPRQPIPFIPKRVLVVMKLTLLNYEAIKNIRKPWDRLTHSERGLLGQILRQEGFDMSELIDSHEKQSASTARIVDTLVRRNVQFTIVSPSVKESEEWEDFAKHGNLYRSTGSLQGLSAEMQAKWAREVCLEGEARWEADEGAGAEDDAFIYSTNDSCMVGHDLCISAGGDGTFLLASLHNDGRVPVIGVNTSPGNSVGRLCCCSSEELESLLIRLERGDYEWIKRHRIRVGVRPTGSTGPGRTLVQSALNEVFVGERDPCRASIIRVSKDGKIWDQYKCSGLLVSTATGATAWAASAAALYPRDVMAVLASIEKVHGSNPAIATLLKAGFDAAKVAGAANDLMVKSVLATGSAAMQIMAREPLPRPGADKLPCIYQGSGALEAKHVDIGEEGGRPAYASTVEGGERLMIISLASQETQALLVLDGRVRVPLGRGREAVLQTCEERALWTFK